MCIPSAYIVTCQKWYCQSHVCVDTNNEIFINFKAHDKQPDLHLCDRMAPLSDMIPTLSSGVLGSNQPTLGWCIIVHYSCCLPWNTSALKIQSASHTIPKSMLVGSQQKGQTLEKVILITQHPMLPLIQWWLVRMTAVQDPLDSSRLGPIQLWQQLDGFYFLASLYWNHQFSLVALIMCL